MAREVAREITLQDRYLLEDGSVYLTGLQALVRLPIDQNRRDRQAGLRIGTFISGYPGSPLGGYDLALQRLAGPGGLLEQHQIVHQPGANEELAATAISGTQMLDRYPHSNYDGVVGIWYGKGPGVDRSGDALKHGNFAGTSKHGAVICLSGEDHEAKSSTMPYQDDYAFVGHGMPILYPASVAEFLELGLHAIALSRFSGCWVAMKLVGPLADGGEIASVSPDRPAIMVPELEIDGRPFQKYTDFTFFPGKNIETERHIYFERLRAAFAYAAANRLNRIEVQSDRDRLGIVSAGKSYADTRQALMDMGLDPSTSSGQAALRRAGIRLLRIGMIYPLEAEIVRDFARDLAEIIVIEEKRGFLESQVKEALCGLPKAVKVVGKRDEHGAPLFPLQGGQDSDLVSERLGPRLLPYLTDQAGVLGRLAELKAIHSRSYDPYMLRTPNYCSGCPHNTSTVLMDGQIAWGSPGCHSFASIMEQPERQIVSMTQLGGEGLPWIGLAPFSDRPHMIQNVGDGSLFHSSYLNIRFAAATGVNMTYKILYNGSAANTGAQVPVNMKGVPELTRMLEADGVRKIAVVTKEPEGYRDAKLAENAQVHPVEQYDEVMKELEREPGVTVFIYDEMCANERRRQQKRGKREALERYVVINERVCEGCGDCGSVTNCMSLHKVETEFGAKTQIHYSSCNQDESCLKGDCPSFVTVELAEGTGLRRPTTPTLEASDLPEPGHKVALERPYHVYIPGVGGTGVITVNALLCFAAWMDGRHVMSYDQTGAAQKWGPVLSSLVIAPDPTGTAANKVGLGRADLYLAFDLLNSVTAANLDRCDPERTVAVVNSSVLPSGEMIRNVFLDVPTESMEATIDRFTRSDGNVFVEARRIAEALFGDYMTTNLFALGVAYQSGLLPLTSESIERAIRLNGVQVEQNVQAFRYGRLQVHDPARVQSFMDTPGRSFEQEREAALSRLPSRVGAAYHAMLESCADLDEESRRLLAIRIAELIDYQGTDHARQYVDFVLAVAEREGAAVRGRSDITQAVIRYLYKLMAYKDEYEVARLQLSSEFDEQVSGLFSQPRGRTYHFHPPLLRAMGLKRKLALGSWFRPALAMLRAMRGLRGGPLDVFGYLPSRREDRELSRWYRELVEVSLADLTPGTYAAALEIAELPDRIRGYEQIRSNNAATVRARAAELVESLKQRELPIVATA